MSSFPAVEPVRFETKIAVLLRDDLLTWQRLNVTAFLVSGIAVGVPDVMGEPYVDGDGTTYLPMFRQPLLVFEADRATISAARSRALARGLAISVFTADLFGTGHDAANRAAVAAVSGDRLDVVGLGLHGPRTAVDKALKGSTLHR